MYARYHGTGTGAFRLFRIGRHLARAADSDGRARESGARSDGASGRGAFGGPLDGRTVFRRGAAAAGGAGADPQASDAGVRRTDHQSGLGSSTGHARDNAAIVPGRNRAAAGDPSSGRNRSRDYAGGAAQERRNLQRRPKRGRSDRGRFTGSVRGASGSDRAGRFLPRMVTWGKLLKSLKENSFLGFSDSAFQRRLTAVQPRLVAVRLESIRKILPLSDDGVIVER